MSEFSTVSEHIVELRGITKHYGDLVANDSVDLAIAAGEIHALLGENGAGKSTLVKILYGVIGPSAGDILWKGRRVVLQSPVDARALGIGMVFQHFSLFEDLTVAENIAVALPDMTLSEVRERLRAVSHEFGFALDPERSVWTLSAGERQRIEIVRCLLQTPKLLILDEPTSVLTPQEAETLFATLERLSSAGCAILYISHKLEEVRRLCRSATILRGGRVIETIDPRERTAREIAALMVGSQVETVTSEGALVDREPVLQVANLDMPHEEVHGRALSGISFEVRSGEIFGIAGIAGNGQSELFAALSGERLSERPETIRIAGYSCASSGIDARRRRAAGFVPEERLGHSAAPTHSLSENALLTHHATSPVMRGGMIIAEATRRLARDIVKTFDVRAPKGDPEARKLSGGNLQKFVIGREIIRQPRLLVVNQPTWGVDAGAAQLIRQALIDLARRGSAVLVISQDLDELFELTDRIAVIRDGMLTAARRRSAWTREEIGLAMLGDRPFGRSEIAHAR